MRAVSPRATWLFTEGGERDATDALATLEWPNIKVEKAKRRIIMKHILTLAVIVTLSVTGLLAQTNPFIGAWKLNTAKSKWNPGPGPQSETRTYEAQGNGVKVNTEGTAADGSRIAYSYTANYDGKDNPISGVGAPSGGETIAFKRVNPNTTEVTLKKSGKIVQTARWVVDGKVLTITSKGTSATGQPTNNVTVWEKQ
jgi:hypothetical protein